MTSGGPEGHVAWNSLSGWSRMEFEPWPFRLPCYTPFDMWVPRGVSVLCHVLPRDARVPQELVGRTFGRLHSDFHALLSVQEDAGHEKSVSPFYKVGIVNDT